jgi:hypothetical protein
MKQEHKHDPKPYIDMKSGGATSQEVYKKALDDGYKKSECLMLIVGIFDIPLHQARKIGRQIYQENLAAPKN